MLYWHTTYSLLNCIEDLPNSDVGRFPPLSFKVAVIAATLSINLNSSHREQASYDYHFGDVPVNTFDSCMFRDPTPKRSAPYDLLSWPTRLHYILCIATSIVRSQKSKRTCNFVEYEL
ncbi:predicted protein [Sclerotinia sclerotiorum 1980 UF-70]|uniref:Uncharacterized protein n=1 Tax=Sclerotinia sclerotiorum (strain ATCC 18683 / 1980 / Ss-1) TaxID=665079 RepID=A7EYE8_SCLS1|nr:predicted protein [Sclerotinia sclerotiorum 1980 UF-70]EDN94490.1 predicted protein [Sclerotinia sclerotiorum 1980 UF-70]